jgi:DNA-binding transcriptional ArsR family regulator
MLDLLAERPRAVHELASAFPVSRPAISRHLRVLQDAGLVAASADGTRRVYSVRPEGFGPVRDYCESFWDVALQRFKMVAENLPPR